MTQMIYVGAAEGKAKNLTTGCPTRNEYAGLVASDGAFPRRASGTMAKAEEPRIPPSQGAVIHWACAEAHVLRAWMSCSELVKVVTTATLVAVHW